MEKQLRDCANALSELGVVLERKFAEGVLWYEADVQMAAAAHLERSLRRQDKNWQFGLEHYLDRSRPDVICYYRPPDYAEFIRNPGDFVVGVIEIKWCTEPRPDLAKLAELQAGASPRLAWMVYGDHFSPQIHRTYAVLQEERARCIQEWASGDLRGCTILRCGAVDPESAAERAVVEGLSRQGAFWLSS